MMIMEDERGMIPTSAWEHFILLAEVHGANGSSLEGSRFN
jgi:hypothetical protein